MVDSAFASSYVWRRQRVVHFEDRNEEVEGIRSLLVKVWLVEILF